MVSRPSNLAFERVRGLPAGWRAEEPSVLDSRTWESAGREPPPDELHNNLSELYANQSRWLFAAPRERVQLLERCVESVAAAARPWVELACEIKHIPADSPSRAEEALAGPIVALRHLRLLLRNWRDIAEFGSIRLPGRLARGDDGRWRAPVLPVMRELFDPICFVNFRSHVWLAKGLCESEAVAATQAIEHRLPGTSLVLGAGNVTGIVAADILGKLFQDQHVVLLKLHPLMDSLQSAFEQAFAPLIAAGVLRIMTGDTELASRAIRHKLVDDVHITGSTATHDAIVWGPSGPDRDRRLADDKPLLDKPITSELGNVTPWIIVPGRYSAAQLDSQAENVAASITNNCGFNCLATRVLVTSKHWPQREDFLSRLQQILSRLPRRVAYYPGALERFERFTGCRVSESNWAAAHNGDELRESPSAPQSDRLCLPWTLFRDVDPDASPLFCREESFAPICAEIPFDIGDACEFLGRATDFANERLWGALCATLTVPNELRRTSRGHAAVQSALTRLNYGTVCVNHWSAIAFATLTSPWGGAPGGTLRDPQSGLGWVHNTFGLRAIDKTVLEGPLTVVPQPVWSPLHPHPEQVAWKLLNLYRQPSLWRVADLTFSAVASLFHGNRH